MALEASPTNNSIHYSNDTSSVSFRNKYTATASSTIFNQHQIERKKEGKKEKIIQVL